MAQDNVLDAFVSEETEMLSFCVFGDWEDVLRFVKSFVINQSDSNSQSEWVEDCLSNAQSVFKAVTFEDRKFKLLIYPGENRRDLSIPQRRINAVIVLNSPSLLFHHLERLLDNAEGEHSDAYIVVADIGANNNKDVKNVSAKHGLLLLPTTDSTVHRVFEHYLAARNLLVVKSDKGYSLKVSDFGLSRHTYAEYQAKGSEMPYRWTALEGLLSSRFILELSDVWSFGVVLWEIFEFGSVPYTHLRSAQEVIDWLCAGNRLPIPKACSYAVGNLMNQTWNLEPNTRPSFHSITHALTSSLGE